MTIVAYKQLTQDMQANARLLTEEIGIVPQATDRPICADDLLFYLSETSMPMAALLRQHGLFTGDDGLHFDLQQFDSIRRVANSVIDEHQAGDTNGIWKQLDLSTDEDADYDGAYILTALSALEQMYAPPLD